MEVATVVVEVQFNIKCATSLAMMPLFASTGSRKNIPKTLMGNTSYNTALTMPWFQQSSQQPQFPPHQAPAQWPAMSCPLPCPYSSWQYYGQSRPQFPQSLAPMLPQFSPAQVSPSSFGQCKITPFNELVPWFWCLTSHYIPRSKHSAKISLWRPRSDHNRKCQGLSVTSMGSSSFKSPLSLSFTLTLQNLLHVPTITKNLLSVSKSVFFEFYPDVCLVKSQGSNEILFKGLLGQDGLYKFPNLLLKSATFAPNLFPS